MRWKLLIVAIPLAALVGALPLLLGFYSGLLGATPTTWSEPLINPNLRILSALLLPLAAIAYASIFVYRHTARRRLLQLIITILLASALTFVMLYFGLWLLKRISRLPLSSATTRKA